MQDVLGALQDDDRLRRLETLRLLAQKSADSTTLALLEALEGTDTRVHSRAAWALSLLPLKEAPEVVSALVAHLQNDPDPAVRLCCAVGLMSNETPQVREAYIHASADDNEKVAQLAAGQFGFRGGAQSTPALFQALSHPVWSVRLAACKSLILLEAADQRVISTLEKLSQQPEAKAHDALTEQLEEINRQSRAEFPDEPDMEMWGTVDTILGQARQIASRQG